MFFCSYVLISFYPLVLMSLLNFLFLCLFVQISFCQIVTSASSESHIPDMQAHMEKRNDSHAFAETLCAPLPQLLLTSCTRMRHTTRKQAKST